MKRLTLCLLLIFLALLGQSSRHDRSWRKGETSEQHYACKLDHGYRSCRCVAMVAREQQEYLKNCELTSRSAKEYAACAHGLPGPCELIQEPDKVEPKNTCMRSCSTHAICQCHDQQPCTGPVLDDPDNNGGSR